MGYRCGYSWRSDEGEWTYLYTGKGAWKNCIDKSTLLIEYLLQFRSIIRYQGKDGIVFLLTHLSDVPNKGKEYGLCDSLRYLVVDELTFLYLKEAITLVDSSVQEFIRQIIDGAVSELQSLLKYAEGAELERILELRKIISHTS